MQHEKFNIPVEEYTTPNPIVAEDSTSIQELMNLMSRYEVRHLPIVKNSKVVGVVSDRDLRVAVGLSNNEKNFFCAADIMAPEPVSVFANESLDAVAFKMAREKIGSVLVLDDDAELLGIFTVTDALNALIEVTRGDDF